MSEEPSSAGGIPPILVPEPVPRDSLARWRWYVHLLLLASYPLVVGALSISFSAHGKTEPALSNSVKGLLIISAVELSTFGALFAVAWLFSRCTSALLYLSRFRPVMILLGLGYSVGIRVGVVAVAAIVAGLAMATGIFSQNEMMDFFTRNRPQVEVLVDVEVLRKSPLYMVLSATLVSFVVAGFREELWRAGVLAGLRVLWPNRFGSVAGQLLGVGVAAVIFGLGHIAQGPLAVGVTGLLGMFLGAIMVMHKSIWPAVLAHGAFNAASFIALPWALDNLPV